MAPQMAMQQAGQAATTQGQPAIHQPMATQLQMLGVQDPQGVSAAQQQTQKQQKASSTSAQAMQRGQPAFAAQQRAPAQLQIPMTPHQLQQWFKEFQEAQLKHQRRRMSNMLASPPNVRKARRLNVDSDAASFSHIGVSAEAKPDESLLSLQESSESLSAAHARPEGDSIVEVAVGSAPQRRSSITSTQGRDHILELADPSRPPEQGKKTSIQKYPPTFQCHLCPKKFKRAYNLRSHLRQHNSHSGTPPNPNEAPKGTGANTPIEEYYRQLRLLEQKNKDRLLRRLQELGVMPPESQPGISDQAGSSNLTPSHEADQDGNICINDGDLFSMFHDGESPDHIGKQADNNRQGIDEAVSKRGESTFVEDKPEVQEDKGLWPEEILNKRGTTQVAEERDYTIKCLYGLTIEEGNTICCESCESWQHIECYYVDNSGAIASNEDLENMKYFCVDCEPRLLDRKVAIERQRARLERQRVKFDE